MVCTGLRSSTFCSSLCNKLLLPLCYKDRSTLLQNKPEAQKVSALESVSGCGRVGQTSMQQRFQELVGSPKGTGVSVLRWCLNAAPRVTTGHCSLSAA